MVLANAIVINCNQIFSKMRHYKPFQFKRFSIEQNNAAMKVGTDSVLLGSWAQIEVNEHILDIGTGTGILPLMLAQKVEGLCKIDAIEIDNSAIIDARINFNNSQWKDCFKLIEQDFTTFNSPILYDVIISNPPFFEGLAPTDTSRSLARNASDRLSYLNLIQKSSQLLTQNGRIYLVIPQENYEKVIQLSIDNGLRLKNQLNLRPKTGKPINRVLIELTKKSNTSSFKIEQNQELIIRNSENNYTDEHILFTINYYLNLQH